MPCGHGRAKDTRCRGCRKTLPRNVYWHRTFCSTTIMATRRMPKKERLMKKVIPSSWKQKNKTRVILPHWKKVAVKKSASVSCQAATTQSISLFKVPLKSYVFPLKKLPKMIDTARLVVTIFLGKKIVFVSKKRKCISSPFCNFLPVFQFCVTKVFSRMLFSAWRLRNLATFWQNSFCNFESCPKRSI